MNATSPERRKFYRVIESASIELYPMNEANPLPYSKFAVSPVLQHLNELKQTEIETRQILAQISEKDRLLGVYLKGLNKKIDTLTDIVTASSMLIDEKSIHTISLSEGGFSLSWPENFTPGQLLATKIILVEDFTGLILKSRVIESYQTSQDIYCLHCEYEDLDDAKRMLLARHIIRKQIKERQQTINDKA